MTDNDYSLSDMLFASAQASVSFAVQCLESVGDHVRAKSSFVNPLGDVMHWHDFGDLEGPGWAANAIGGAHLLWLWGRYTNQADLQAQALTLVDHVLHDGFVREDGFIYPYWELAEQRFCLNYKHQNDWLCPGSLAKVGVQLLDFADVLAGEEGNRTALMREAAQDLCAWLVRHIPLLESGWVPRRITIDGEAYTRSPDGGEDSMFTNSADGLFLIALCSRVGTPEMIAYAQRLGDAFIDHGGYWGSINHDTYDNHENVAYAVAFRELRRAASILERPAWVAFAYDVALPAMHRFRMTENLNGVYTTGLFWMEETWDTAYLWENAEVAQAHFEAWLERGNTDYRDIGSGVLEAITHHHYGTLGFLTEGVDWNNHVGQQHHVGDMAFAAIRYTEPLLNNLHFVEATLTLLKASDYETPTSLLDMQACIRLVNTLTGDEV